jgi:biotin carboxylase
MMALGIPIPKTALIPPKEYEPKTDLNVTLQRYAKLFNLGQVGEQIGYPAFMKPYDGGGWQGVSKVDDEKSLWAAYDAERQVDHAPAGGHRALRLVRALHRLRSADEDDPVRPVGAAAPALHDRRRTSSTPRIRR